MLVKLLCKSVCLEWHRNTSMTYLVISFIFNTSKYWTIKSSSDDCIALLRDSSKLMPIWADFMMLSTNMFLKYRPSPKLTEYRSLSGPRRYLLVIFESETLIKTNDYNQQDNYLNTQQWQISKSIVSWLHWLLNFLQSDQFYIDAEDGDNVMLMYEYLMVMLSS